MAELILSPIADKIIGGLESAVVKEIASLWRVNNELDKLEETIFTIKAVLLDAEEKQAHNHQVRNWLQRLGVVVRDADDLMDVFNTEALRRQATPGSEMVKQVCTFFSASNQLVFRHKMGRRIWEIRKRLVAISKDKNFLLEVRNDDAPVTSRRGRETHSFVRQEEVVGRDEDRVKILKLLLDQDELGENVAVIPIVGMGGLGKTTLAQSVFNEEKVQQHFELKIWVCVSDDFDLKLVVQQTIKSTVVYSMDHLQNELRKILNGKRYLLVLDDMWEESREKWFKLKELFLSGASHGSRIVVTTRSKMVAKISGTVQPYQLGVLDEEQSWALFEKMAFKQEEPRNLKIMDIGRQIVQRCGGVPLAIRAIGSMLHFKNSDSEWLSVYEGFVEISQQKEDDILPTLKLSYDHLTSHLKCCFAYCRLFPKGYKIEIQTLIRLWMAQGLLYLQDPGADHQCLEDVGYGYFMDLFERSFFQEVEIDESGIVRTCKMHDLMHDLTIKVAGKDCAIASLNSQGNISKFDAYHVSFSFNISSPRKISASLVQATKVRTLLLLAQHSWENKWNESACDAIISNFKLIRTLDLSGSGITILPKSIGRCKHLRYLDLSKNWEIKILPNSITNLPNLQTLRLNGCSSLQELPRDLKKLINLRHLEVDSCYELTHMPSGLSQLKNIQTLSKYILATNNSFVARNSGKLKELRRLNKLKGKLEILNLRPGKDSAVEYEFANLKEKRHLRSLELKWISNVNNDETEVLVGYEMSLEVLQPHSNLQELALANYGGAKISGWLSSLTNLVNLSFRWCKKCRHLVPLKQFHSLKRLELEYLPCLEYINGEDELTSETTIILPSLQELRLKSLPNLKGWWRDEGREEVENSMALETASTLSIEENRRSLPSFPCLSKLVIQDCPRLTCMPLYPHLEESLWLENTRLKPFQETIIKSSIGSKSSFRPLSKLTYLDFRAIEDLHCLPDWFKSLVSLRRLKILRCSRLKDLSPGIQHLSSLGELRIAYCKELEEVMGNKDSMMWKSLNTVRLQSLGLQGFHRLVALPEGIQHLTSLQELRFWFCDSLTTVPEWINNLTSLKLLQFRNCPKLTSLPEGIRGLTSLKLLSIAHCPILLKKCQRHIGEDWPKIAHIEDLDLEPDPNEDNQNLLGRLY